MICRVALIGAAGKMNKMILGLLRDHPEVRLTGAFVRPGHPWVGLDVGTALGGEMFGVVATDDLNKALHNAEVAIDFSSPEMTVELARAAAKARISLVIGTTGLEEHARAVLLEAARVVPVVYAPNMGVGIAVLRALVEEASRRLGRDWDVEVLEIHHRDKKDSPSGTALVLGGAALSPRGQRPEQAAVYRGRGMTGPRTREEAGFASLRGGDVVGEHTVFFLGPGERIELTHRATDRGVFARGALRAARWLHGQEPALYDMRNVLGLVS